MPDKPDPIELLRRTAARLTAVKAELDKTREPIAIIGMACRFPGAQDLEAFWSLLSGKVDAITEVPADRWDIERFYDPDPDAPGKMTTRYGGFLEGIDLFDPQFFSISPKEAMELDPQQRLLLEVSWRALEHAAIAPASLVGTRSGVYAGISTNDYNIHLARGGEASIGPYWGTGNANSVAVGRVSYVLGLEGPAMAVDTACSASLVSVIQACQGLRGGDCDLALAGGVNAVLTPDLTIYFSRGRFMAADGRCKTFDARGDGYVRGEGCGMVVLKRLSDAERDGDRVLAVIRGGAVNQDGASSGLTVPNGPAQERVIAAALARANVEASEVAYVEAHGTGTPLGDPIEVHALHNALRREHPDASPLLVGSVKTNIGHLESAAGIASVIKVALSLSRGRIPAQLHFETPSPKIAWDDVKVEVVSEARRWPQGRRLAGISGFAVQGTNAHLVLEGPLATAEDREESDLWPAVELPVSRVPSTRDPSQPDGRPITPRRWSLLPLSAKSEESLSTLAERHIAWMDAHPGLELHDFSYAAGVGRSHFTERASIVFEDAADLRDKLSSLAGRRSADGVMRGAAADRREIAFLFTGQGSQYLGMGKGLYDQEPVVRAVLDRCDAILRSERGTSLLEVMFGQSRALLDDTAWTQPALFSLQAALVELYRGAGVQPSVVLGHSVGEFAAAYAAGIFDLEEGLRLISARGALMSALPDGGSMAAIFAQEADVRRVLADVNAQSATGVDIAADNGGHQVVSGPSDMVEAAVQSFVAGNVRCEKLATSCAFHSALLDPMLGELEKAAGSLSARSPGLTLISNVTGARLGLGDRLDGAYWRRHARSPVQFAKSVETLVDQGVDLLVEIGPHPVLATMARLAWPGGAGAPASVPSLMRGRDDGLQTARAFATLYAEGTDLDFAGLHGGERRRRQALPTYPFQRQRYWVEVERQGTGVGSDTGHSLLGGRFIDARGQVSYEVLLSTEALPWLSDHRVFSRPIVPGAAYVEMASAAAARKQGGPWAVQDLRIEAPLALNVPHRVQTIVSPEGQVEIFSRPEEPGDDEDAARWTRHVIAEIAPADVVDPAVALDKLRARLDEEVDAARIYEDFEAVGLDYGPAFRAMTGLHAGADETLVEVTLGSDLQDTAPFLVPPMLLDGALHGLAPLFTRDEKDAVFLPVGCKRVQWFVEPRRWTRGDRLYAHARSTEANGPERIADLDLMDARGGLVGRLQGFRARRAEREVFQKLLGDQDLLYEVAWRGVSLEPSEAAARRLLLVADEQADTGFLATLRDGLEAAGATVLLAGTLDPDGALDGQLSKQEENLDGIAWLVPQSDGESADALAAQEVALARLLSFAQAVLARQLELPLGFSIVTRRAVATAAGEGVDPFASSLWGFGRSLQSEQPTLGLRLLDVASDIEGMPPSEKQSGLLAEALTVSGSETQLALRGDQFQAPRLAVAGSSLRRPEGDFRVAIVESGSFDGLAMEALAATSPGAGEVTVAIEAIGLTFRDVLIALGAYPGEGAELGGDAAGIVTAVGEGVSHLAIGDRVYGMMGGGFASRVTTTAATLRPMPANLDFVAAATVPSTFCTAQAAFEAAGLRSGQKVLVHAAAGGVGLAAIQLARAAGAEVYATASAPKRRFLRSLGVSHVFDSRSTDFAAEVVAASGGGVDMVLNSLTGEGFIEASVSCLVDGGHFVEIAKRNIWSPEQMAAARPDLGYTILALDQWAEEEPDRIGTLLGGIGELLGQGLLEPLPRRLFPISQTPAAMRLMQQARHVGKIVLTVGRTDIAQDGSYLVTGGLGGLGMEAAAWLAAAGARHLVLVGRNQAGEAAANRMSALTSQYGCTIETIQADVSDSAAVESLVGRFGEGDLPPLAGVVHAAGVLDDGIVTEQRWDRFETVLRPKLVGAWNLHRATRGKTLTHFVLYSSAAATLGSASQSNYAAANAFLDGLAAMRQSLGLPATSVAWGPWALGMTDNAAVRANIERQGYRLLVPESAQAALATLLADGQAGGVVLDCDWGRLGQALGGLRPPILTDFLTPQAPGGDSELLRKLEEAPADEREALLERYLQDELRAVLGLAERPAAKSGFFDLGMDSLMAVEFRNRIVATLGDACNVTNTVAFDHPNVERLAKHLAQSLGAVEAGEAPDEQESRLDAERRRLEEQSEEDVLRELSQLVEDLD